MNHGPNARPMDTTTNNGVVEVSFPHGLGDCTYFAHQLPLYVRRGFSVRLHCPADKEILFRACEGVEWAGNGNDVDRSAVHSWQHGPPLREVGASNFYLANKAACNFSRPPMPNLGLITRDLWDEFRDVRLSLRDHLEKHHTDLVAEFTAALPRPLILVHTKGNTMTDAKNLDDATTRKLYLELLDRCEGTLILLDWDQRVPKLNHGRVRHLLDDWSRLSTSQMVALIDAADLVLGIDSGPAHVARFTDTPVLVVWRQHHPAVYSLPRPNHAHLVPRGPFHRSNTTLRTEFNLIESDAEHVSAAEIATSAIRMLKAPRYLDSARVGTDTMLRQFVEDWTNGGYSDTLRSFVDRHFGFSAIIDHLRNVEKPFRLIETGTIRATEDWKGAGYSTYLFGLVARELGGKVTSVDIEPAHCNFARTQIERLEPWIEIVNQDSADYLAKVDTAIDVLYLDSMDCFVEGYQEHAMNEARSGFDKVKAGGLIGFDDTVRCGGTYHGKGGTAVPWLLERGCSVVHSGHQTILRKPS